MLKEGLCHRFSPPRSPTISLVLFCHVNVIHLKYLNCPQLIEEGDYHGGGLVGSVWSRAAKVLVNTGDGWC